METIAGWGKRRSWNHFHYFRAASADSRLMGSLCKKFIWLAKDASQLERTGEHNEHHQNCRKCESLRPQTEVS